MRKGILIGFLLALVSSAMAQEAALPLARKAIEQMKRGETTSLDVADYKGDANEAATAFAQSAQELLKPTDRIRAVGFAVTLEKSNAGKKGQMVRSKNLALKAALVSCLERESDASVAAYIASQLTELFPPRLLDENAEAIGKVFIEEYKEGFIPFSTMLLYATLPSNDGAKTREVLFTYEPLRWQDAMMKEALLARLGDEAAERRFLEKGKWLDKGSLDAKTMFWLTLLQYVPTPSVKKLLRNGLDCERVAQLPSGEKVEKRALFASALASMMRDDESFPVKREGWGFSEEQYALMKKWCSTHL